MAVLQFMKTNIRKKLNTKIKLEEEKAEHSDYRMRMGDQTDVQPQVGLVSECLCH